MKDHVFFKGIDWTQVYLQKYPPPLIPPKGEVNAADAFDIGSFDEEDTKGIKVVDDRLREWYITTRDGDRGKIREDLERMVYHNQRWR